MGERRQSWSGDGSWRGVENRSNFNQNRWQTSASRPPVHPGVCEDGIPLWEKKYCTTMLRMPWKMMCLNQNYMGLCKNVMEWDDSGALEAFQNAKSRFCAEYHGAPCSIPLPDPDLYIDKVDYDCFVDPELVEDLDKEPPPPVDVVEFGGVNSVIVRDSCNVTPSGWDDVADNGAGDRRDGNWDTRVEQSMQADGWRDAAGPDNSDWNTKERNNDWSFRETDRKVVKDDPWNSATTGWGNAAGPENSGWNAKERNNEWGFSDANRKVAKDDPWNSATTGWGDASLPNDPWSSGRENQNEFGRNPQPWNNKNWESNRRYGRKRDAGGRNNGRYTKPKFNLGVYQPNNDWRNYGERNSSDSRYERKVYPKQPLAW